MRVSDELLRFCMSKYPLGSWRRKREELHNSTGLIICNVDDETNSIGIIASQPGIGDELIQEAIIGTENELACFLKHALKSYIEEADFIVGMENEYGISVSASNTGGNKHSSDEFFSQLLEEQDDVESVSYVHDYSKVSIYSDFSKPKFFRFFKR